MMEDIRKKKEEFKKKNGPKEEGPVQWLGGVKELHRQQSEYPEDRNNIFKDLPKTPRKVEE